MIKMRYKVSRETIGVDQFSDLNDNEFIWEVAKFDPNILQSKKTEIKVIQLLYDKSKVDENNNYISEWIEQKIDVELLQKLDNIPEELLSVSKNYSTPFILELDGSVKIHHFAGGCILLRIRGLRSLPEAGVKSGHKMEVIVVGNKAGLFLSELYADGLEAFKCFLVFANAFVLESFCNTFNEIHVKLKQTD